MNDVDALVNISQAKIKRHDLHYADFTADFTLDDDFIYDGVLYSCKEEEYE